MEGDANDDRDDEDMHDESDEKKKSQKVYLPGVSRKLKENEELVCDESAYRLLHKFETEYPCLSFDTVRDSGEAKRDEFPASTIIISGTQAEKVRANTLILSKVSNLKEQKEDDSESEDEDDDEEESTSTRMPISHTAIIPHHGGVNRIRSAALSLTSNVCAVWSDQSKVQIWNVNPLVQRVEQMAEGDTATRSLNVKMTKEKPLYSFVGHLVEGFALDWSPMKTGQLASGDNKGRIHIWQMHEGGTWAVDQRALDKHTKSAEDIQWSPTEETVLASCSADGTLRLWDTRLSAQEACVFTLEDAHSGGDVNVLSWNRLSPLLVSGGDDKQLKVWDLKLIKHQRPVATFKHHTAPITSVDWCPHDDTVFAATSEDDQTTIWDLAVEADDPQEAETSGVTVPPQLMFVHMGQTEVKEVRWHRQNVGLLTTTASDGFNIFRTISI